MGGLRKAATVLSGLITPKGVDEVAAGAARERMLARRNLEPTPGRVTAPPAPLAPPTRQGAEAATISPERARYEEAIRRSDSLPLPEAGRERLYRVGEIATKYKPPETVRMFGRDIPYDEFQRDRAAMLARTGARDTNPSGAAGRWFGSRPQDMEYYVGDNPLDTPIYYADVPVEALPATNVQRTPYSGSTLNPEREFVLPDEYLQMARRILVAGAPITAGALSGLNGSSEKRTVQQSQDR